MAEPFVENLGTPILSTGSCASGSYETWGATPFFQTDGQGYNRCFQGGPTTSSGSTTNQGSNAGGFIIANQTPHGAPVTQVHPQGQVCVSIKGKGQAGSNQNYFCGTQTDTIDMVRNHINNLRMIPAALLEGQQLLADVNVHQ